MACVLSGMGKLSIEIDCPLESLIRRTNTLQGKSILVVEMFPSCDVTSHDLNGRVLHSQELSFEPADFRCGKYDAERSGF